MDMHEQIGVKMNVLHKKREAVILKLRARNGFTLMEIMVVLAVIALLTATLYPSYALARQRANVSTLLSSSPKVLQYLELYRMDHQFYPTGNVAIDESHTGTDMLKAYYERSTPWPWDKEKKLESFFAYKSTGSVDGSEGASPGTAFLICWPVDKSANKAAEAMATATGAETSFAETVTLDGYDYAVCATSSVDPVLVKLH